MVVWGCGCGEDGWCEGLEGGGFGFEVGVRRDGGVVGKGWVFREDEDCEADDDEYGEFRQREHFGRAHEALILWGIDGRDCFG